jgi:hypothetical protein
VELTDVRPEPDREALATVTLEPPDVADEANWLYVLAWQGGGSTQRVVDRLQEVGDGVYRSTEPIPLSGSWKSGLRLHDGRARGAVPLRLPADEALAGSGQQAPGSFGRDVGEATLERFAGAELPAPASFERPFLEDGLIVLRETKGDVADWLWGASIAFIFSIYALFISGIALGVARITRRDAATGLPEPGPSADARVRHRFVESDPAGQ